jgi:diadenosine tetraphosphate (Ap4A) HIT family hydrolase
MEITVHPETTLQTLKLSTISQHWTNKQIGGEKSLVATKDSVSKQQFESLEHESANKGCQDATGFRNWAAERAAKQEGCLFCGDIKIRQVAENDVAFARTDKNPTSEGHTLIIPKRHVASYHDLHPYEIIKMHELMGQVRNELTKQDKTIAGFNVGVNDGKVAGQTIFHVHMHLIPRREGDVKNPQGGVRHVIPEKGHYKKE